MSNEVRIITVCPACKSTVDGLLMEARSLREDLRQQTSGIEQLRASTREMERRRDDLWERLRPRDQCIKTLLDLVKLVAGGGEHNHLGADPLKQLLHWLDGAIEDIKTIDERVQREGRCTRCGAMRVHNENQASTAGVWLACGNLTCPDPMVDYRREHPEGR